MIVNEKSFVIGGTLKQLMLDKLSEEDLNEWTVTIKRKNRGNSSNFSGTCFKLGKHIILRFKDRNLFTTISTKDCHGNDIPAFKNFDEQVYWLFLHEVWHAHVAHNNLPRLKRIEEKMANWFATKNYLVSASEKQGAQQ